ncbi:MAG TPA: MBL fold metallo-hydrolase [Longimicrobium sp.]|jgi:phosphoribosyl 1,2-cyclic phosphate phosphodiesterase
MRLRFLGTGTSFGVPVIGCRCAVCASGDPRDRRTRHAALLQEEGRTLLVDTPPELRLQLIAAGVRGVDAVWYTHTHADHVHGVDDLRVFSRQGGQALPVYAHERDRKTLVSRFAYVFDPTVPPLKGTSKPEAELHDFRSYEPVRAAGFELLPLPVPHGDAQVHGFRVGGLGYITDAKRLPPRTEEALRGVRVLVLNALWWGEPHPNHFSVEEACETAGRLGAERTYLTHLSHRTSQAELDRRLPAGVRAAYDGLEVEV